MGTDLAFHCAFWSKRSWEAIGQKRGKSRVGQLCIPSFVLFLFCFGLGIGRHMGHSVRILGFCFETLGGANTNMGWP